MVFNKIDLTGLQPGVERDEYAKIVAVRVSARTGAGIDELRSLLGDLHEAQPAVRGLAAA
jgi:GTPase